MKYLLQSTEKSVPPTTPFIQIKDWYTMHNGASEFDNLGDAMQKLRKNANMARIVWPMRVIDLDGKLHAFYEPENDMRLPGCRQRAIERNAHSLWEQSGQPDCDGIEFWLQAERELPPKNGITIVSE